jgi:hypothetical protein
LRQGIIIPGKMNEGVAFRQPRQGVDAYSVSTPYGVITISDGGRKVSYELYSDIRQSRHNTALFTYVQELRKRGVTRFNTDHLNLAGRDRTLALTRGKAKLDLVYEEKGKIRECELKTSREIGLDTTAQQLTEFARHCEHLWLLVPRGCLEDAAQVVNLLNLTHKVSIAPYDYQEDEEGE